jgi:voltage-gated potassium channel
MLRGLIASFILVSLCTVIHTLGLVLLADWLIGHPLKVEPHFSVRRYAQLLTTVFALITLLHLVETAIWAAFFDWQGHFSDFETSWYFSLGSYTTIGYGDVVLPEKWRLLGGIEGISGVLLCGLSAAFLFGIVNHMFQSRLQQQSARSGEKVQNDAR